MTYYRVPKELWDLLLRCVEERPIKDWFSVYAAMRQLKSREEGPPNVANNGEQQRKKTD